MMPAGLNKIAAEIRESPKRGTRSDFKRAILVRVTGRVERGMADETGHPLQVLQHPHNVDQTTVRIHNFNNRTKFQRQT